MRPVSQLPEVERSRLRGLLFDLDDTLLDHGRLSVAALDALYRLSRAGLLLLGVTGRPASWGQVLARQWPVDAMVTENGILGLVPTGRGVTLLDRLTPEQRQQRRAELARIVATVRERFRELVPSDDSLGRLADATLDIGETQQVDPRIVGAASAFAQELGARTVRSSVHLHLSLDVDDKASGVLRVLSSLFGVSPGEARAQFAFIGDSENDAACFAAFHTTVGVANLRGEFSLPPRFITSAPRGSGFVELADVLLQSSQVGAGLPPRSNATAGLSG
jgi:HAD superfamily hydrolase (TIGR01484 family)